MARTHHPTCVHCSLTHEGVNPTAPPCLVLRKNSIRHGAQGLHRVGIAKPTPKSTQSSTTRSAKTSNAYNSSGAKDAAETQAIMKLACATQRPEAATVFGAHTNKPF